MQFLPMSPNLQPPPFVEAEVVHAAPVAILIASAKSPMSPTDVSIMLDSLKLSKVKAYRSKSTRPVTLLLVGSLVEFHRTAPSSK